ncbi:hypothetical protein EWH12_17740 [Sphingobium cupriresistens]|uniref:HIRAN domain-containing protein n=1 Tax=Sphingobium cupriresistens TaxID=1132417 RepID=A0A8G2DUD2_9SPHN|nr:hypothetical protein EWH12_17740 [Sphingobium cupriresistens]
MPQPAIATSRAKAYVPVMFSGSTLLAIEGADYPNHRGAERRAEIAQCRPGDPLTFRRLRGPAGGKRSVGVYSERGVQLGYVGPDDLAQMPGLASIGRAIFQSADTWGCVIAATADGSAPVLRAPRAQPKLVVPPRPPRDEYCDIFPAAKQGRRTRAADPRHSDKIGNQLISNKATKGEPVGIRHDK